ncbi:MAG: Flp pilus assembly protein CpaB [Pirellulales bacterium]
MDGKKRQLLEQIRLPENWSRGLSSLCVCRLLGCSGRSVHYQLRQLSMRAKSIILLIIALACGTVASVGVSQVILDQRGNVNEVPMADVVVVAREIEANQKIPLDAIKIEKWPQTRLPEGVITKIQDIDGHFTRQKLFPGEPIIAAKIADSTNKGRSVPMGYRVFDLPVDERKGAAGYIQPGDFVDVHGLFKIDNVSESRVVVSNVQIFGVNGSSVRDEENKGGVRATTFQLLVKEGQLESCSAWRLPAETFAAHFVHSVKSRLKKIRVRNS